jgi:hypothetical protein
MNERECGKIHIQILPQAWQAYKNLMDLLDFSKLTGRMPRL